MEASYCFIYFSVFGLSSVELVYLFYYVIVLVTPAMYYCHVTYKNNCRVKNTYIF